MDIEILEVEPNKKADEKEIFKIPETKKKEKKKKEISQKQRDALAKGRARVKANREAKKKELEKAEQEAVKNAKKIEKEQKLEKKKQKGLQEKIEKKIGFSNEFNAIKNDCFKNCKEEDRKKLNTVLDKYITPGDIEKGKDHIQDKIGFLVMKAGEKLLVK